MASYPNSPLMGQMMGQPLLVSTSVDYAARHVGGAGIVSRPVEGELHRDIYRNCQHRACRMAHALGGIQTSSPTSPTMRKTRSCSST